MKPYLFICFFTITIILSYLFIYLFIYVYFCSLYLLFDLFKIFPLYLHKLMSISCNFYFIFIFIFHHSHLTTHCGRCCNFGGRVCVMRVGGWWCVCLCGGRISFVSQSFVVIKFFLLSLLYGSSSIRSFPSYP